MAAGRSVCRANALLPPSRGPSRGGSRWSFLQNAPNDVSQGAQTQNAGFHAPCIAPKPTLRVQQCERLARLLLGPLRVPTDRQKIVPTRGHGPFPRPRNRSGRTESDRDVLGEGDARSGRRKGRGCRNASREGYCQLRVASPGSSDPELRVPGSGRAQCLRREGLSRRPLHALQVVATLGTTSCCSFDRLPELGPVCEYRPHFLLTPLPPGTHRGDLPLGSPPWRCLTVTINVIGYQIWRGTL